MATVESVREVYSELHDKYKKVMGKHPSKFTPEKRTKVCIQMIEDALREDNHMYTLVWAYDWIDNPDVAADGDEHALYGQHHLFNRLSADECAEMKIYAEVGQVAYDMDFAHSMKMPPFLSHLGKKFDIDNDELCDFIFEDGHELFSLRLAVCMAAGVRDRNIGVNGIYQDRLAREVHRLKSVKGKRPKKEVKEKTNDLMNLLFKMHNHEELGKMLGLRGWRLGNYDAIEGWFREPFNPRIVKMTKELNQYIVSLIKGEMADIMPKTDEDYLAMLRNKLTALAEKHKVTLYEEDLTFNYIFSNNCHLFNIILTPAD